MSQSRTPFTAYKGISCVVTVQLVDSDGADLIDKYDGTESLSASAWPGDDQAQSFPLTAAWNDAALGLVDLTVLGVNTDDQSDGAYQWLIQLADGSAVLARGSMYLSGTPGTGFPGDPDLTTLQYLQLALSVMTLSQAQTDYLPFAVQAASNLTRRYCNQQITRYVYTQYSYPSIDGLVLLQNIPINSVNRISLELDTAITITANTSDFQIAYVSFIYTGDYAGSDTPQTYTGIQLNWVSNGVSDSEEILFADNLTLADLVASINAVTGWNAQLGAQTYGAWPTSELYLQDSAQGAVSDTGVNLQVFSTDTYGRVDHRTGMLALGPGYNTVGFGPRWGPDWLALDDQPLWPNYNTVCRVIYDAGYDIVPPLLQNAVAEVSKAILIQFQNDYLLKKESIGAYSYELRDIWEMIPLSARQAMSLFRVTNA